ncbi:unnamed protein product [Lasius platythorax]|uniref:Uncharacterized protein n=1 Tax=Lasius platythorax TaxID=488582 RepID=A0AAV2NWB8_9HYME
MISVSSNVECRLKMTHFAVQCNYFLIYPLISSSPTVKITRGQDKYLFCHNGSLDFSAWEIIAQFSQRFPAHDDYGTLECH